MSSAFFRDSRSISITQISGLPPRSDEKAIWDPSGENPGWVIIATGFPPVAEITKSVRTPSPGSDMNTIIDPSGEYFGFPSRPGMWVRMTGSPPATGISQTSSSILSTSLSTSAVIKAPSGDQLKALA